jgi:hypothetical protein
MKNTALLKSSLPKFIKVILLDILKYLKYFAGLKDGMEKWRCKR